VKLFDKNEQRALRIMIAMPCGDTINAGTTYDLACLAGYEGGRDLAIAMDQGAILPAQRQMLVERALASGATHILWLDSDMRFPKDTLSVLLGHEKDIVAANYTSRRQPYFPVAENGQGQKLYVGPSAAGLVEVAHVGLGCMLVDTEVYAHMKRPFFALGYNAKENEFAGEDVYFCRQAKKAGFVTYIDNELSKVVGHTGEVTVTMRHASLMLEELNRK
jgi:hypothetical protein